MMSLLATKTSTVTRFSTVADKRWETFRLALDVVSPLVHEQQECGLM